jgi:hypothetical protein
MSFYTVRSTSLEGRVGAMHVRLGTNTRYAVVAPIKGRSRARPIAAVPAAGEVREGDQLAEMRVNDLAARS